MLWCLIIWRIICLSPSNNAMRLLRNLNRHLDLHQAHQVGLDMATSKNVFASSPRIYIGQPVVSSERFPAHAADYTNVITFKLMISNQGITSSQKIFPGVSRLVKLKRYR